jgi:hypothetical protein
MRFILPSLIAFTCFISCDRQKVTASELTLPSLYRCSAFTARAETGGCYEIQVSGDPPRVAFAIYGDGTQEIKSSNSNGDYEVHDYQNDENWNLTLKGEGQYLIHQDRSVEQVVDFARVVDGEIKFRDTDNRILQCVVRAFHERHKSK